METTKQLVQRAEHLRGELGRNLGLCVAAGFEQSSEAAVRRVLESQVFIMGPEVDAFEKELAGLLARLREHEAAEAPDRRVAVSADGPNVFLYADTEAAARAAESAVQETLGAESVDADIALDRWHPLEERWEDASVPLPQTDEERRVEHERLEAEETAESQASGVAEWEVKVELESHHDAEELADRLEAEGWSIVRRWKYVLVGCSNEDEARALADDLKEKAPAGAAIEVEPGAGLAWEAMAPNPYAFFGGLGG
jgi:hypothetical protein